MKTIYEQFKLKKKKKTALQIHEHNMSFNINVSLEFHTNYMQNMATYILFDYGKNKQTKTKRKKTTKKNSYFETIFMYSYV